MFNKIRGIRQDIQNATTQYKTHHQTAKVIDEKTADDLRQFIKTLNDTNKLLTEAKTNLDAYHKKGFWGKVFKFIHSFKYTPKLEKRISKLTDDIVKIEKELKNFAASLSSPIAEPSPLQKANTPLAHNTIESNLKGLESKFKNVRLIAKHLIDHVAPHTTAPPVPEIPYSQDEALKSKQKIVDVENYLIDTYGQQLEDHEFHGRLSHQRILWQDDKFIDLLADPDVVKAIFFSAHANEERQLTKSGYTLSSMILFGLASNQLSFLLSATPNWKGHFSAHEITEDFLNNVDRALENITEVLSKAVPISEIAPTSELYQKIEQQIDNATSAKLYHAISLYVEDKERAQTLVKGVSEATELLGMNNQCLMAMDDLEAHLQGKQGKDYADVLNWSVFSHCLDPKHLAAAIWKFQDPTPLEEREQSRQEFLKRLLEGAIEGSIGKEASQLMQDKFKQILLLILDNCEKSKNQEMLEQICRAL